MIPPFRFYCLWSGPSEFASAGGVKEFISFRWLDETDSQKGMECNFYGIKGRWILLPDSLRAVLVQSWWLFFDGNLGAPIRIHIIPTDFLKATKERPLLNTMRVSSDKMIFSKTLQCFKEATLPEKPVQVIALLRKCH